MLNAWEREQLTEIEDQLEAEDPRLAKCLRADVNGPPGRRRGWWVAIAVTAIAVLLSVVALMASAHVVTLGFATVATAFAVVCCWPYPWRAISRATSLPRPAVSPAGGQPSHPPTHRLESAWWAPWLAFPDDVSRNRTRQEGEESR